MKEILEKLEAIHDEIFMKRRLTSDGSLSKEEVLANSIRENARNYITSQILMCPDCREKVNGFGWPF